MKVFSKRLFIINTFGTFGYMSVLLQWLWALIVVGSPFITSSQSWFMPVDTQQLEISQTQNVISTPLAVALTIAVTIIMVAITIYSIFMVPRTIGKTGSIVTHKTADLILPSVSGKMPLSKKKRLQLSYNIVTIAKLVFCLLPLIVVLTFPANLPIDHSIVQVTGLFCALVSIIYFGIQLILVQLLKVQKTRVW